MCQQFDYDFWIPEAPMLFYAELRCFAGLVRFEYWGHNGAARQGGTGINCEAAALFTIQQIPPESGTQEAGRESSSDSVCCSSRKKS